MAGRMPRDSSIHAAAAVGVALLAGPASSAEPPAVRTAIEDRQADYWRQNPGVPVWPSTCDCISIRFGFKDASGKRPVRFSFADAGIYYGSDSTEKSDSAGKGNSVKGPVREASDESGMSGSDVE